MSACVSACLRRASVKLSSMAAAPTPALVAAAAAVLRQPDACIARRFQALFTLRNADRDDATAVSAMSAVLSRESGACGNLRHECAFCLGQMRVQDSAARHLLLRVVTDASEDAVVRHEAAEALAAIASGHRLDSAERGALS